MALDIKKIMDNMGTGKGVDSTIASLASILFHSRTQVHIMHLQSKSYSQHMALNGYYEGIGDLIDRLVEGGQGKLKTIVTGYTTKSITDNVEPIQFFSALLTEVEGYRKGLVHPFLEQVCDDIIELISSTSYKLMMLK